MYKVLVRFMDLQDENHIYEQGDTFPRNGVKVSAERINELTSCDNKIGCPLIEKVSRKRVKKDVDADM